MFGRRSGDAASSCASALGRLPLLNGVTNLGNARFLPVLPPTSILGIMPSEMRLLGCGVLKRESELDAGVRNGLAADWLPDTNPLRIGFGVAKG